MSDYRKTRLTDRVRCAVAERYGAVPGVVATVRCHYCPNLGEIYWYPRKDGTASSRVVFALELDHVVPESQGGASTSENIVLSCRRCNRRKGHRFTEPPLSRHGATSALARVRH